MRKCVIFWLPAQMLAGSMYSFQSSTLCLAVLVRTGKAVGAGLLGSIQSSTSGVRNVEMDSGRLSFMGLIP